MGSGIVDTRLSSSDDNSSTTNNTYNTTTTTSPVDNSATSGDISNKLSLVNSGGAQVNLVDAGTVTAMKELMGSGLKSLFQANERTIDTAENSINKAMELAKGNSSASNLETVKIVGVVVALVAAVYFLPDIVASFTGKGRSKAHA